MPISPTVAADRVPFSRDSTVWERFYAETGGSLVQLWFRGSKTKSRAVAARCGLLSGVLSWRMFSLSFESVYLKLDTIPKPGGLGFASALRAVAVQLSSRQLSNFRPGFVQLLSRAFWALE